MSKMEKCIRCEFVQYFYGRIDGRPAEAWACQKTGESIENPLSFGCNKYKFKDYKVQAGSNSLSEEFTRQVKLCGGIGYDKMIEIAVQTNWKYPEKNEFPENYKKVLVMYENESNKVVNPIIAYYISAKKSFFVVDSHSIDNKILAWCELPFFNKA